MLTLLISTRNAHKIEEIRAILRQQFVLLTLNDFPGAPEVFEDAGSFAGNASKKSVTLANWVAHSLGAPASLPARGSGKNPAGRDAGAPRFVLADDSGLQVEALLTPVPVAHSKSASPVCHANEAELETELFEGTCEGQIGFVPQGLGGFGYDPLFVPDGHVLTFAELGEEVKNKISHRAKALEKLERRLLELLHQNRD